MAQMREGTVRGAVATKGIARPKRSVKMTVAQMTREDLRSLVRETVEQVLAEWWDESDEGLELRPEIAERLRRQRAYLAAGGKTLSLEELEQRLAE